MKPSEAIEEYVNGNITRFKAWLKHATKLQMLDAIEYYSGNVGCRYIIINTIRKYLEG